MSGDRYERRDRAVAAKTDRAASAILELPEVRASLTRVSVEAYEAMGERGLIGKRCELFRGFIVDKPIKSPRHCVLAQDIFGSLRSQDVAGHVVLLYAPLRLADSMPEPDVMVVRGKAEDFHCKHPDSATLVVEIADGSAALDRENRALYAEANIPEYWIVLLQERQVEVHWLPGEGVYRQKLRYSAAETLVCEGMPGVRIKLSEWFGESSGAS